MTIFEPKFSTYLINPHSAHTLEDQLEKSGSRLLWKEDWNGESKNLQEKEKHASLIIDEMTIKMTETYNRNLQLYVGAVDMGGVTPNPENVLAIKVLGMVISGLSTHLKFPVAYFLWTVWTVWLQNNYNLLLNI